MLRRAAGLLVGISIGGCAAAGCATAGRGPEAPASPAPMISAAAQGGERDAAAKDPSTDREAEVDPAAELARAEAELDRALGLPPSPAQPAPPTEGPARLEKKGEATGRAPSTKPEGDPCATACRALASMRRSAERLCDLGGGSRCEEARDKVERAEERVRARCECGS